MQLASHAGLFAPATLRCPGTVSGARQASKAGLAGSQTARRPEQGPQLCRLGPCRAVLEEPLATASIDLDFGGAEGAFCEPGFVEMDSTSSEDSNVMTVEVKDYPGLLRVCAWVLNGLDVVVNGARLQTTDEGYARNQFWLQHRTGKKLSPEAAQLVAERVGDYVVFCTPDQGAMSATRFGSGQVTLDNAEHPECSVVRVREGVNTPGTLLQCAAAITGVGVTIHEAIIQGCTSCGKPEADPSFDHSKRARLFEFQVTESNSSKLDYARATALIYTLNMALGLHSTGDLMPPGASAH